MKVANRAPAPGGFMVTVEFENAYTDGTSRFEQVFVANEAVKDATSEQVRQAVIDAVNHDPIGQLVGQAVDTPTQTKAVLEVAMVAEYEEWRRWQQTRIEAQARALPAGVITALTNQENASWGDYATSVQAWRLAP